MPVGKYKTFAACVAAQKKKGHTDEEARKICGKIQAQSHAAERKAKRKGNK